MFASIAAMMVANPGMPAGKHKKTQADTTAVAVGDSVTADSLGKKISMEMDAPDDTTKMDSCRRLYGNIIRWWMTVSDSTVSTERNREASTHLYSIRPMTRWYMMPTTRWRISMETRT